MVKKIAIGILALTILMGALFIAIRLEVFVGKEEKLKKEENIITAIEIYNDKFLNSKNEAIGRKILLDKIESMYILGSIENYELLYDYLENNNMYGYLEKIVDILEKFANEKPGADVEEVLKSFKNIEKLVDTITPLKMIYANPSDYYGKQVILYGLINNNDIKRKMLEVGTSTLGYVSDSYPIEIEYSNKDKDNWIDADYGPIIAKGTLKKYSNSNDVYLVPMELEYTDSVNLGNWYVEFISSQESETKVSKESILNLADSIMENVDLMDKFTSEIIERWTNAISSKKDFNQEIQMLYQMNSSEFTIITLAYTSHIFTFADMKNVPTELSTPFYHLETLENLYADLYKTKLENPSGTLLTYTKGVVLSLEEIRSVHRKLLNSF